MTEEEHMQIKDRAKSLLELLIQKDELNEKLKNKKQMNKQELKSISRKLKTIEEILDYLCLLSYDDIFNRLSNEYSNIKSETNKKLYFRYAFLKEDNNKNISNYMPYLGYNEYFMFVPSDSKQREYAWYINIIDMKNKVIPIEEKDDFENKNYIITSRELPYENELEYHKLRLLAYNGITDDIYQERFEKYRANFFRILIKSSSEEDTIMKTYLRYSKKRTPTKF